MTQSNSPDEEPSADALPDFDLASVNAARIRLGMPPVHARHPRRARSIYLSDVAWLGLSEIARSLNIVSFRGGSVAGLLEAIGAGLYEVTLKNGDSLDELLPPQVAAPVQAEDESAFGTVNPA